MVLLSDDTLTELKNLAQEVCQRESCRLYDLEFIGGGRNRVLRVFVLGLNGRVTIDKCAEISRGLSWLLDTQDVITSGRYNLEVSSPGLERQLKEKWHFEGAIKEVVKFSLTRSLDIPDGVNEEMAQRVSRVKQLRGVIVEVLDDRVVVEFNGVCWKVLFDDIRKAQVVFDFKKATREVK